jgi:hypothetical protein
MAARRRPSSLPKYGLPVGVQGLKEWAWTGDRTLMETVLYHLTTLAVVAVVLVLFLGLWNLSRGKSPNTSQKLMRWRVGLQAVAIFIILLYVVVHNYS